MKISSKINKSTKKIVQNNLTKSYSTKSVFDELEIRGIKFKNRIGMSPMCQYSSVDGFINDFHLMHYGSKSYGTGMMLVESTAIQDIGRISPDCLGIYKDEHVEGHKRVVSYVHKNSNCKIGIQLAHSGRKGSTGGPISKVPFGTLLDESNNGWRNVSASPIPLIKEWTPPIELSIEQIKEIVEIHWADSVKRAAESGYDFIEIHGANGYLVNSFLSPLSNQRKDKYGGSFENRTRFLLEIVNKVRSLWNGPLFVRLSAEDVVEGGWKVDDSIKLAELLRDNQVDLVDVTSGGILPFAYRKMGPLFQIDLAEKIKKSVKGIHIATTGGVTTPQEINSIVEEGKADVVLVGRQFLREAELSLRTHKTFGKFVEYPRQYGMAIDPDNYRHLFK